jgi:hypothetical protein
LEGLFDVGTPIRATVTTGHIVRSFAFDTRVEGSLCREQVRISGSTLFYLSVESRMVFERGLDYLIELKHRGSRAGP